MYCQKYNVKIVADNLLVSLGYKKLYNVNNPFEWMDMISIDAKTNQFDKRVSEYRHAKGSVSYNGVGCIGCTV